MQTTAIILMVMLMPFYGYGQNRIPVSTGGLTHTFRVTEGHSPSVYYITGSPDSTKIGTFVFDDGLDSATAILMLIKHLQITKNVFDVIYENSLHGRYIIDTMYYRRKP